MGTKYGKIGYPGDKIVKKLRKYLIGPYLFGLYLVGPLFSRPLLNQNFGLKFLNGIYDQNLKFVDNK